MKYRNRMSQCRELIDMIELCLEKDHKDISEIYTYCLANHRHTVDEHDGWSYMELIVDYLQQRKPRDQ